jgi:hypothetical protein
VGNDYPFEDSRNYEDPRPAVGFTIKDSGQRMTFDSGMQRDPGEGKVDWALVYDGPLLLRWAIHLTNGAKKYAARNWMKANSQVELERARTSAARHFAQWMAGDEDEDHAAATVFNLNLAEYVKERLRGERT